MIYLAGGGGTTHVYAEFRGCMRRAYRMLGATCREGLGFMDENLVRVLDGQGRAIWG
jgi:hypothetical protein